MQTTEVAFDDSDEATKREIVKRLAEQQLLEAKTGWEQARLVYREKLDRLNQTVQIAADSGMNQSEIGRALNWPRQRVSKLLADLTDDTLG